MTFQYPLYLFALCGIPLMAVLFFLYSKWKKQRIKKIGDPLLVRQLISNYSHQKFIARFVLAAAAFALLVTALANPRKPAGSSNVKHRGIDVMIALDVSRSMLAQDIKPNRLERAKQFVSRLIDRIPDDRVGIVVFAGRSYLQMPLTSDLGAARLYLSTATPETVPTQGTVIADALQMSYASFNAKEKKYKAIVLISDGEDHDERAEKLARSLADEGVIVNCIGIGSAEGSTIDDPVTGDVKKDAEGKTIITKLNETGLKNIAALTGGIYISLANSDEAAAAVQQQLGSMEKRGITEMSQASFRYYFPWLLALALILLLTEFFMGEKKQAAKARRLSPAVMILLCLAGPVTVFSQNNSKLISQGNDLYKEGKYGEAAVLYKKAISKKTGEAAAHYNLGNALYKNNDTDSAIKAYDKAIAFSKTNKEKAETWYNKGVLLQNEKKLPECIHAYKQALRYDPSDEDARLNLQKALQQQKQQQQQQQDQQKKEQKKQPQQQQPRQPKPQQSKMTKKEAEEKLKALLQQEKNLQDKLKKTDAQTLDKPEKDW